VLGAVRELEDAQPAIVSRNIRNGALQYPQLDYPWENPVTNQVEWPVAHLPIAQAVRDPRQRVGADLLKFAHALSSQFNILFP
jgi:hypothetical protein